MNRVSNNDLSNVRGNAAPSKKRPHDNPSAENVPRCISVPPTQPPEIQKLPVTLSGLPSSHVDTVCFINRETALNRMICRRYREEAAESADVLKLTTKFVSQKNLPLTDAWACMLAMRDVNLVPDMPLYTALITRCVESGEVLEALKVFSDMHTNNVAANSVIYDILVRACRTHRMPKHERVVRELMHAAGFALNVAICNRYRARRAQPDEVRRLTMEHLFESSWQEAKACLDELKSADVEADAGIYRIVVCAYAKEHLTCDARQMLEDLARAGIPSDFNALSQLIAACEQSDRSDTAKELLNEGVRLNVLKPALGYFVGDGDNFVDFHCDALVVALPLDYLSVPAHFARALFKYHCDHPAHSKSIGSHTQFIVGVHDAVKVSKEVAECMRGIGLAPVTGVKWNGERNYGRLECGHTAISKCLEREQIDVALEVLDDMIKQEILPDAAICLHLISACLARQNIDGARKVCSAFIVFSAGRGQFKDAFVAIQRVFSAGIHPDDAAWDALISACGKANRFDEVFDEVFKSPSEHKLAVCNAMIQRCAQLGYVDDALAAFKAMLEGEVPPNATSYAAVIASCRKAQEWTGFYWLISDAARRGIEVPTPAHS